MSRTYVRKSAASRYRPSRGKLDDAANVLKDLNQEIEKSETSQKSTANEQARPIPVEVRNPEPGPLSTLLTLITPLLSPLAATGIVILFVIFILLQREELRNRLIRLAGAHDLPRLPLHLTTQHPASAASILHS
jgi:predicted PurR-regulated permease PerM